MSHLWRYPQMSHFWRRPQMSHFRRRPHMSHFWRRPHMSHFWGIHKCPISEDVHKCPISEDVHNTILLSDLLQKHHQCLCWCHKRLSPNATVSQKAWTHIYSHVIPNCRTEKKTNKKTFHIHQQALHLTKLLELGARRLGSPIGELWVWRRGTIGGSRDYCGIGTGQVLQ